MMGSISQWFSHSSNHSSNVIALIGPSILNADLAQLSQQSQKLLDSGADYLHLDVMDGHFVPNITFGHPMVACLRKSIPSAYFDMHMMVSSPLKWIKPMSDCGATQYTFHYEAIETNDQCFDCIRQIRESNMKVGIAIKPNTSIETILPFVEHVDCVLIMTVEPGFGGQKFMVDMMEKVKILRDRYASLDIEVDGGVTLDNIQLCANSGANMIVSGTGVVSAQNPGSVMFEMRRIVNEAIQTSLLER